MRLAAALQIAFTLTLCGCGFSREDGRDRCTIRAIGKGTGSGIVVVNLSVPERYVSGAEIANGGIFVDWRDCDYPLNAFLSQETADHIIGSAPSATLTHIENGSRLVRARLLVWKFKDESGEPRFFVTSVAKLEPITDPKTVHEGHYFVIPRDGS